ncbi:hypothetical protein [Vibrio cholerae]|uniref:hypothetical protein n=1 Tax=Vibrio cholerae TaxID=666 RepID=UPI00265B4BBF|nr:hypothetical protein [Vibrio cholerae]
MAKILPDPTQLADFIAACQRPLRKSIRVNTLKISVAEFCQRAAEKEWQLTPVPYRRRLPAHFSATVRL